MKLSFKILAISLFAFGFFMSQESFAAKYSKKKPPISQMMLGDTTDPKTDPKNDQPVAKQPDATPPEQPAKDSEKK